ncbi:MAG: xanthine dehydrogenase family protein molybdopterin-binding subunit [Burkholderiales bacterium]|nr:xanthine dehydrogenase family protein molybdopterin-binding subunit [Burkholderiales bacterium]
MSSRAPLVGTAVGRLEDARLVRGSGEFVADLRPAGLLHAVICRSPAAHGRIVSLDLAAARASPGVRAVFAAADLGEPPPVIPIRTETLPGLARFEQPVLAHGKVRYAGEPIAVVVADSPDQAEDAAECVRVEIERLPAIPDRAAAEAGAAVLFEQHATNLAGRLTGVAGDAEAAVRGADYVRRECFRVPRIAVNHLETRGVLAQWREPAGRLVVSGAMKVPFATRGYLARLFGVPEDAVEVRETDVGGGFGARGEFYPEDFLVPYAARLLRRPVRWIESRSEHQLATAHAREVECELEIACRRDGTILALRGRAWSDLGAYVRPNAMTAPRNIAQMAAGPYRVPSLHVEVSLLLTNKTPAASFRGPGRFEVDFFRERLIDLAARDLGIDRVEVRRRNLLTAADMPHALPKVLPYGTGGETDSGDYRVTFERCLAEIDWDAKAARAGRLAGGRYHGLGVGCYIEGGSTGPRETARLALGPDGTIAVYVGSSGIGQGLETIFAQIAADALDVPLGRIRGVFHGSTGLVREGLGSWGSRATVMGGSAILVAAANLKQAIRAAAGEQFGCAADEVEIAGEFAVARARGKSRTIAELSGDGFEVEGVFENNRRTYSYGTHAAHVAVDPETGRVEVLDYVSVEDVGRIINPATLHGQVIGAIVQGLGTSLRERLAYDRDGQLLSGTLADYALPGAGDFPRVRALSLECFPSPANPLGAKGAGEGGIIPVGGVIANAVASALQSLGVEPFELPLTPALLWESIERAKARKEAGAKG